MLREPAVWHASARRLADGFAAYVQAQVDAGADVIQLFDSWAGEPQPGRLQRVRRALFERVLGAVSAPTIHFGTGTAGLLTHMRDAGGDVIGLDWRVELDRAWAAIGAKHGVQGNLDPRSCWPGPQVAEAARTCCAAQAAGLATSSISATACCRRRIPDVLTG